jgi:hypothetical protein
MSEKVEKFLARMGNIWGIPRRIDDEALGDFLADWEGALKQFDAWVIDAAATRIVHDRSSDRFPLPAEVRKICFQIVAEDRASKPTLQTETKHANPYKLADELMAGALGKRAAREGWALTLRDFIAEKHRLPEEGEVRRLIRVRDEFVGKLNECIAGKGGNFGGGLTTLGRSMAKREHEIASRLLGTEAPRWYVGKIGGLT